MRNAVSSFVGILGAPLLGLLLVSGESTAQTNLAESFGLLLTGQAVSAGVAGLATVGDQNKEMIGLANSDRQAIYGVIGGERRDHPCYLEVLKRSIRSDTATINDNRNPEPLDHCAKGKGPTKRSLASIAWSGQRWNGFGLIEDADIFRNYVSGVQVCMASSSLSNRRIKGIRLFSARILPDGTLEQPQSDAFDVSGPPPPGIAIGSGNDVTSRAFDEISYARPNCGVWADPVYCPEGMVATAFKLHLDPYDDRNIAAIEPFCRTVEWRSLSPKRVPRF